MYEVKNKVCLVTGAAGGIGAGIVKAFLQEGAKHVAILDLDVNGGQKLEKELNAKYGSKRAKFFKCDVTVDIENVFDNVTKEFGYIDVVVNNAGLMNDSPRVYAKEIAVNVTALVTSSLKAYEMMREDRNGKGGTIINISSIVGLINAADLPVYSATKSAVLQFSVCLGKPLHNQSSGVRVIAICFGVTETSLLSKEKIGSINPESEERLMTALEKFPKQTIESAVSGLLEAYKRGESASTWLVTTNRPAEDITANVTEAYRILSQGVFCRPVED